MAFDNATRKRLNDFVGDARALITDEFAQQLQSLYGISAKGDITPIDELRHLNESELATAAVLRARIDYLIRSHPAQRDVERSAVDRLAREQAFTVLNRLAAVRMAEKRGLIVESVGRAYQSKGFQVFERVAGAGLGESYSRYRRYLFSLFDELAVDLGVLFDRRLPQALLFPREPKLLELFGLMNTAELDPLWAEDETIGWIYQYYNDPDERAQMRDKKRGGSEVPRNSRELAVRNQFFTPRYVVEFLSDNTLGRLWYEMRQGQTALRGQCRYLVRRPNEIFLKPGESAPEDAKAAENLSQEELLRQPVCIPHRPIKDPREIRLLDPACGSMHFGLYAFDLYTVIYDEAWEISKSGAVPDGADKSFSDFCRLTSNFASKEEFLRQVPRLIVEHNIHGIDIDPRAAQIAGLSLWLRAQRAWHQAGVKPTDRPRVTRSNLVCAEPMPGEKALLREFVEQQFPAGERPAFAFLLEKIFDRMTLAGEAGSLLRIEEEIRAAIAEARALAQQQSAPRQVRLFPGDERPEQAELDLRGLNDEQFWQAAEQRIYDALEAYAERAENGGGFQRRLFAGDAAQGFAFIDLCRKRYDVAVMNPPFGDATPDTKSLVKASYPDYADNLYVAFHERAATLLAHSGMVGAISSRTFVAYRDFETFRSRLLHSATIIAFADLGWEVLDGAQVETAAFVTTKAFSKGIRVGPFFRLLSTPPEEKESILTAAVRFEILKQTFFTTPEQLNNLPGTPLCYWSSPRFIDAVANSPKLQPAYAYVGQGASPHAFFFRAWWEVASDRIIERWARICRGGDYSPYYRSNALVIDWYKNGSCVKEYILHTYPYLQGNYEWKIHDEDKYFLPGLTWGKRNERFNCQAMPANHIFTDEGQGILPNEPATAFFLLGYVNCALVAYFLSLTSGLQKHWVYIRPIPVIEIPEESAKKISSSACAIAGIKQKWDSTSEISGLFCVPFPVVPPDRQSLKRLGAACFERRIDDSSKIAQMRKRIDEAVFSSVDLSADDVSEIEALVATFPADEPNTDGLFSSSSSSDAEVPRHLISFCFGVCVGRWDIRYATGERPVPELPDPFAPLPICPPGMLQGDDGLPLSPKAGRRLRAERLYPLDVAWDGILVDDSEHPLDVERRVNAALTVLWGDGADALEREACALLGVPTLREWFRRPAGFFAEHLKRYSKSRRQAPIYWPLSTASGSYTLWLYYHRLTDQTLYSCLADFIDPKIKTVESEIGQLREKKLTGKVAEKQEFHDELRDLKTEIEQLIKLPWRPNLNDGVLITAAPLWKLFRHSKWQKDLKTCWEELQAGDHDWAHLAYTIWPQRVKEKCKTDRSLAIAHGLEDLCEVEAPKPKKAKAPKKSKSTDEGEEFELEQSDGKPRRATPKISTPRPSTSSARDNGAEPPVPIEDTNRDEVMCVIRQVFSRGAAREREEALKQVSEALGYQRLGTKIREILGTDLLTAVRRGILTNEDGMLSLTTGDIRDCARDSLKDDFLTALGRSWKDREEAIRNFARFLGYARTGPTIEDTARSVINGLIRENRIESDGERIRRR